MAQRALDLLGVLLSDYCTHLRRGNYARRTQQAYQGTARRFLAAYPKIDLLSVTPEHIERYLDSRPRSPRSREVELECLRSLFSWAYERRLVKENPCDRVVRPRWKARERPSVRWEQFEALCAVCRTHDEQFLVEMFYFTGLRMSELLSIRGRDVDLGLRRIYVVGKGDRERTVVYPQRVQDLLAMRAILPDELLFGGPRGGMRDARDVNGMLSRLGEDAKLPYHLTAHLLRHGFSLLCKKSEVPLEIAAKLAGNSIQTMAKVYGKLSTDDLQEVYDKKVKGI